MSPVKFRKAFYIKLGRGGRWEADSIASKRMRFGWPDQSIADINGGNWDRVEKQLRGSGLKPSVATTDFRRLRDISTSSAEDIWLTFHQSKLWWARLADTPVEEDAISKYRQTLEPWRDTDITGRLLVASDLPGRLAQLQGFRGTVCRVQARDILQRVLAGARSERTLAIAHSRAALAEEVCSGIRELHWKDFETLADLVFRDTGWIRVGVLGQQAKGYDLELREPITGNRYVVQVKSRATLVQARATAAQFSSADYRRLFLVVHSPAQDLLDADDLPDHVELIQTKRLAELVVEAGLVSWLEDKLS